MMQGLSTMEKQTLRFIEENPVDLVLTRVTRGDDGAGGTVTSNPTPLPPQQVRIVAQTRGTGIERRTIGGETVMPDMNLVGMPDTDVLRGDTFQYQGLSLEVVWVNDLGYEKICEVSVR